MSGYFAAMVLRKDADIAFSVSLHAALGQRDGALAAELVAHRDRGVGAGGGDVLAGCGLQAGDRALGRQHVPGDDRDALLAELADVGEDRRAGPVDGDGTELGAGERGLGERDARPATS